MREVAGAVDDARVSELWIDELGRLTDQILHGLRNGLQGVGINIEVIRSRTDHGSGNYSDLRSFAINAARQFEDVSAQIEALAFLSRTASGSADIGATTKAITTLLNAGGRTRVALQEAPFPARAAVSATTARLVLSHLCRTAVETGSAVSCEVRGTAPVAVAVNLDPAVNIEVNPKVVEIAEALHIKIMFEAASVAAVFPTTLTSDTVLV